MQHPELRHSYDDEISSDEIHHDVGTAEIGTSEDYDCVSNNDENIHHQPPRVMSIKTRGVMLSMRDEDPNHRWLARPAASPSKGIKSIDGPSSMISSKKVPSTTPNTIKDPVPKLTLEDIRAGLGSRPSSSSAALINKPTEIRERHGSSTDENIHHDPNTAKLLNLCLELLEFTQLLESSRAESAREWTEKCQVVRKLEGLYDSVRDREAKFRRSVAEQREKFLTREGKYFNLKKRARQHLREWQGDRDRFALEARATHGKIRDLEVELSNLTQIISEQKGELLSLRDKAKNMPSEKETTDLNLKLRSLQNENAQLLTDRATLKLTLDELGATLQKRLPPSTPESLTAVFNTVMLMDDLSRLRSPRLEEPKAGSRSCVASEIAQLEKAVDELQDTIRLQTEAFQNELEELRRQRDEFLEYRRVLKDMMHPQQSSSSSD